MCESVCFQSTVAFVLFVFCFSLIRMRLPAAAEVFFARWSFSKDLWRLEARACQDVYAVVCGSGLACLCVCVFTHA